MEERFDFNRMGKRMPYTAPEGFLTEIEKNVWEIVKSEVMPKSKHNYRLLYTVLGGVIAAMALVLKMPLLLIVIALIPVLETLSVMIQVTYYKKTGKRIFKMTPIHHHFELSGWSENKIVTVFSLITLILCVVGLNII